MGVTNATADDYARNLDQLLPQGPAWPREGDSETARVFPSIGAALARAHARLNKLIEEADARTTEELLPDFERALGLPDTCMGEGPFSFLDRRNMVVAKLTEQGGQSRQYFIDLAARYGEPGVTITEFRRMTCTSRCTDRLYGEGDVHTWRVDIPRGIQDGRPMNCNSLCTSALYLFAVSRAECPIRQRAPAHTFVFFAYTGATAIGFNYTVGIDPLYP